MPGTIRAAAIVTWVTSGVLVLSVLAVAGFFLVVVAALFDAFEPGSGNPRWIFLAVTVVVLVLCALASVLALHVVRGRRWAAGALGTLSMACAVMAGMWSYYVLPAFVALAYLAVVVLLALRPSRVWLGAGRATAPAESEVSSGVGRDS